MEKGNNASCCCQKWLIRCSSKKDLVGSVEKCSGVWRTFGDQNVLPRSIIPSLDCSSAVRLVFVVVSRAVANLHLPQFPMGF